MQLATGVRTHVSECEVHLWKVGCDGGRVWLCLERECLGRLARGALDAIVVPRAGLEARHLGSVRVPLQNR
jgi:hypothetical protein